jgi:hypothetical protein
MLLHSCRRNLACALALVALPLMAACGTTAGDDRSFVAQPDAAAADQAVPDGEGSDAAVAETGSDVLQLSDAEPEKNYLVYAHTDNKLFTVDPKDTKLALTEVGSFNCIGGGADPSMTDIAVDKDGKLFGVSATAVYLDIKVSGTTVDCGTGKVAIDPGTVKDSSFYGLTFAPATPALGGAEALIGANSNGDLYQIDKVTGKLTLVGNFGKVPSTDGQDHDYDVDHVGKNWELSGDIVFLENAGSPLGFATLRDCPNPPSSSGCSQVDTLVEINVAKLAPTAAGGTPPMVTKAVRGKVLPDGCSDNTCGFGSMYGIAAWKEKVYGFARGGGIISIDNTSGKGSLINMALPSPAFAGAGVTTVAPVIAPVK